MTQPLRILHVIDALEMGGLENGVINLVERMDPTRFEHVICAMRRVSDIVQRISNERVRVICLNTAPGFSVQIGNLRRLVRSIRPDVVHSRNWGSMEAVIASKFLPYCSAIHSEHGMENNGLTVSVSRRIFRRSIFEMSEQVLTVSYQLRELHARETGYSANKIGVIHNGVDIAKFRPDRGLRNDCRTELGIGQNCFCMGVVGRLEPVKDLPTLFTALELASDALGDWRLVVAGIGSQLDGLSRRAESHSALRGRVRFLGNVRDVTGLLNGLDAYVLPSLYEGISNSLMEALATGIPAVATKTGGNPEVIGDSTCAYLVPVNDAAALADCLVRLRRDDSLRRKMGQQAVDRVRTQFSLDSMVRAYSEMYTNVVAAKNPHRIPKDLREQSRSTPSIAESNVRSNPA